MMDSRNFICLLVFLAVVSAGGCTQKPDFDVNHAKLDDFFVLLASQKAIIESESLEIVFLNVTVEPGCFDTVDCIEKDLLTVMVRVSSTNTDCFDEVINLTGKAGITEGVVFETCDGVKYSIKHRGVGEVYPGTEFAVKRVDFFVSRI